MNAIHSTNGHSAGPPLQRRKTGRALRLLCRELRRLRRLVCRLLEHEPRVLVDLGQVLTSWAPPADVRPERRPAPGILPKAIHQRILQGATAKPQTARKLIQAAGYKFNSHSREALTFLVKIGKLQRAYQGGYCLPKNGP